MGLTELLITAIGLSMDAFAVALCKGLCMKKINYHHSVIIGIFFGGIPGRNAIHRVVVGPSIRKIYNCLRSLDIFHLVSLHRR